MIAYPFAPPLTFRHDQGDRAPPVVGENGEGRTFVKKNVALMRIKIGDGAQQKSFTAAGSAFQADALSRIDLKGNRANMTGCKMVQAQRGQDGVL